jgi:hypothetical protein
MGECRMREANSREAKASRENLTKSDAYALALTHLSGFVSVRLEEEQTCDHTLLLQCR